MDNNVSKEFMLLLTYLTAHEKTSVFERCWHELAQKSLRAAYARNDLRGINALLMASTPEIRPLLVSWFKRLGIQVVRSRETRGGYRAISIEDRSRQNEIFEMAKTARFNPSAIVSGADMDKPWFDDLEIEERGHSVRAYQGGRASGK